MVLNRDFIGNTWDSADRYEVAREKIRDFAKAIGDTHPISHSIEAARSAGYRDVVAPPTFAMVVTFGSAAPLLLDPDFGLDYSLVVHGEQRFVHRRPITAGDVLSTRSRIESVAAFGRHERVETHTEVLDDAGALVCTSVNVLVSRGTAAQVPA